MYTFKVLLQYTAGTFSQNKNLEGVFVVVVIVEMFKGKTGGGTLKIYSGKE